MPAGASELEGVRIWLDHADRSNATIDVHVGERRVGSIEGDLAASFEPPIAAAEERDEAPWTYRRLVRRLDEPVYVLDLTVPDAV
jgi:hypothetical protein